MDKTFRNLLVGTIILHLIGWYFWGFRFNLDTSPMQYATAILAINVAAAWWVYPRSKDAAWFLLGTSGFIAVLNLILLRGIVTLR